MENKDFNKEEAQTTDGKQLEWGAHNPKLTESNFIDRNSKKLNEQDGLLTDASPSPNGQEIEE